ISARQTHARIWWALSLMVLWTFSWVIGGTRISLATEHRNKVRPSREGPVWQVDVKATGWAKFTTRHGPRGRPWGKVRYVCFPTEDVIIVTFVTRETNVTMNTSSVGKQT